MDVDQNQAANNLNNPEENEVINSDNEDERIIYTSSENIRKIGAYENTV